MDRILLFGSNATKSDLENNIGVLARLNDASECGIDFSIDGNHILTLSIDTARSESYKLIEDKSILKVYHQDGYEYFTIIDIDTSLDIIEVSARQKTIEDTLGCFCVDIKPRELTCQEMLTHTLSRTQEYLNNVQYSKEIEVFSNISTRKSTNFWHDNLYNAINDMAELYNAEIKRERLNVSLLSHVGSSTPVYKVEYAENLLESNKNISAIDIVTKVLAKGYGNLYANGIVSSSINYGNMPTQTIEITYPVRVREEGVEDEEGYTYFDTESLAKSYLTELAKAEFSINNIDKPKLTFGTKFIDLSLVDDNIPKTVLKVGDVVSVKVPKNNIDINVRIIGYNFNVLTQEIEDVQLSNEKLENINPPTLNAVIKDIKVTNEKIVLGVENAKNFTKAQIIITDEKIEQKVSNEEFNTYKEQTADTISQKVSRGDEFATEFSQNADGFDFNIGNDGTNIKMNKDGLSVKNGSLSIKNNKNEVVFQGDSEGNIKLTGDINNYDTAQGRGVTIDKKGVYVSGANASGSKEKVGGLRYTKYDSDLNVNGVELCNTSVGDYVRISSVNTPDFEDGNQFEIIASFIPRAHPFLSNYVGSRFYKDLLIQDRIWFKTNADNRDCKIASWANWDFGGWTLKNCNLVNTYASPTARSYTTTTPISSVENDTVRYIYKDVSIKNGTCILNLPNIYSGNKYTVVSIVKKGRGDCWVASEEDNRFTIEGDNDFTINVEISIEILNMHCKNDTIDVKYNF